MESEQQDILGLESTHTLLRIYSYYRVLLGSLLLFMYHGGITAQTLGANAPELFSYTCLIYTFISITTLISLWRKNFAPSQQQLLWQLLIDVSAVSLLIYASATATNGLAYLLIITVAYGGIFLNQQLSLLLASVASLATIAVGVTGALNRKGGEDSLLTAGAMGVLLFLTALLFRYLTQRLQKSQREAAQQTAVAHHLQSLTQQIVERMNTGILVVDGNDQLLLANNAAYRLLGQPASQPLHQLPRNIGEMLSRWQESGAHKQQLLKAEASSREVRVSFAALKTDEQSDTLIFLEDNRQLLQQAQQIKLASLGRLTASIAHEVRNPLGAISHASQLLAESPNIDAQDKRLTDIIGRHSERVNSIIENVLELSRRRPARAQTFDLIQWLENFVEELQQGKYASTNIQVTHQMPVLYATMDTSQLHQVMTNLCDNGIRYSNQATGCANLDIHTGIDERSGLPFIDIIDCGRGVEPDKVPQLFEPFNTSNPQGTGLGLYLSKELCDANEASLEYKPTAEGKSCFRVCLAHDQRVLS